jgi:hypothetical protein
LVGPKCNGATVLVLVALAFSALWWVRIALVGMESLLVLAERLEMAVVHPSETPSGAVATSLSELAAAAGATARAMEASMETMCGPTWGPTSGG